MGTEQLPHLITLKQNTYTFYESAAEEFFSHCFQQTFAPSCFLFSLLPICTRGIHKLDFHTFNLTATHKKPNILKNLLLKMQNKTCETSQEKYQKTLLTTVFFSFTPLCQR